MKLTSDLKYFCIFLILALLAIYREKIMLQVCQEHCQNSKFLVKSAKAHNSANFTLFTYRTCRLWPIIAFLCFIDVISFVICYNISQFISSRDENRSIHLIIGFGTFTHVSDHILLQKSNTYYNYDGIHIDKPQQMPNLAIIYKFYS